MRRSLLLLLPFLAGCATKQVAVVPPPIFVAAAPVPPPPPPLPPGASPGMQVPAQLADGSFPTPNRQLTPAATLWHLRAGLNVAALACPGAQGAAITAAYNAMLTREKARLAAAEKRYAAEFEAGGGDWRDRYDDAMTRLYNFWSQTPARGGLCAAAERTLAEAAVPGNDMETLAGPELAALDRPFTDFYRAYDAWRTAQAAPATWPAVALASLTPATPPPAGPPTVIAAAAPIRPAVTPPVPVRPRLELDPSIFADAEPAGR